MPGLVRCFSCGRPLSEDSDPPPTPNTPRVRAVNPLAPRAGPPRPRRLPVYSERWWMLPWAALDAVTPGLSAWRFGEHRLAAGLLAGAVISLGLVALSWTSIHHAWSLLLLSAVMLSSAATAAQRRWEAPEPWDLLISGVLGVAGVALVWFLAAAGMNIWRPRIRVIAAPNLPYGTYLIAPLDGSPDVNELVVVRRAGRLRGVGERLLAPVLAVEGQRVSRGSDALLVDGAPTAVPPLNPNARLPPLRAAISVPPGYIVVYAEPLLIIPLEQVEGRLSYRWAPPELRGPVPWPPEQQ